MTITRKAASTVRRSYGEKLDLLYENGGFAAARKAALQDILRLVRENDEMRQQVTVLQLLEDEAKQMGYESLTEAMDAVPKKPSK